MYGFLEDDTEAVMASVWSDHPIIRLLFAFAFMFFVIYSVCSNIYSSPKNIAKQLNVFISTGLTILIIGLFGLGIRSS